MCSGTVGRDWVGLRSVDGPSITDFLDTSPTSTRDLSDKFSIGP